MKNDDENMIMNSDPPAYDLGERDADTTYKQMVNTMRNVTQSKLETFERVRSETWNTRPIWETDKLGTHNANESQLTIQMREMSDFLRYISYVMKTWNENRLASINRKLSTNQPWDPNFDATFFKNEDIIELRYLGNYENLIKHLNKIENGGKNANLTRNKHVKR